MTENEMTKNENKEAPCKSFCDKNKEQCGNFCFASIESNIRSRHCFMTGEHCSKQSAIQRERKDLYDKNHITAFVIMNFSDMSDVFYKWRLRTFIESLTKYLRLDKESRRLYCGIMKNGDEVSEEERIQEIEVIRSDSDPASNYVICSRICQQIQIADLVIVDVSSQNANVFYEFGMAVALGKLILPICYSESFYKMIIPEKFKAEYEAMERKEGGEGEKGKNAKKIKHHMGLYPWRKDLFEYYGIRYKAKDDPTGYAIFKEATKTENGFPDIQYNRFPYHEVLEEYAQIKIEEDDDKKQDGEPGTRIGQVIYERLKDQYNNAKGEDNTLVVYTMDAFLNEEQAGRCIVNFYQGITARMRQEKCFCGERVGVLAQENMIPESEKDSKDQVDIFYNVGEIIQIGVNQATYMAAEEKIKPDDSFKNIALSHIGNGIELTERQEEDIDRFVKTHIRNRVMRIYPNNPVFVDRMKNLLHKELLNPAKPIEEQACDCCNLELFCLYHVMLRTLRYTNEVVVDISDNCLQSLFWLGAAHGSDIYAITVMHERTDKEKIGQPDKAEKENRYVFDVAGLWTAILRKSDTERFYEQLVLAQNGIERHSKLMLPNNERYKKQMQDYLFPFEKSKQENKRIEKIYLEKEEEEERILESYYRDHFWMPMLAYNKLSIYISQKDETDLDQEPRLCTSSWDFKAISVLSYYLSKRKVIGEYVMSSQPAQKGAEDNNFICIGSCSKSELSRDIYDRIKNDGTYSVIHKKIEHSSHKDCGGGEEKKLCFKGFEPEADKDGGVEGGDMTVMIAHQPKIKNCTKCRKDRDNDSIDSALKIIYSMHEAEDYGCRLRETSMHCEIAQLILWREDKKNLHERSYFWVGIIGGSGPATYALSTLFIDEDQKSSCFKVQGASGETEGKFINFLCDLQSNVRQKFMEVFLEKLKAELSKIELKDSSGEVLPEVNKSGYYGLVDYAVTSYLRTVLYKYFFPFLTNEDMDRIYNGIYTFVNSMKASRVSPFALNYPANWSDEFPGAVSDEGVKAVAEKIPEVLHDVLKSFKGFEAFYTVQVKHDLERQMEAVNRISQDTGKVYEQDDSIDTRELVSIQKMDFKNEKGEDAAKINYFFVGSPKNLVSENASKP